LRVSVGSTVCSYNAWALWTKPRAPQLAQCNTRMIEVPPLIYFSLVRQSRFPRWREFRFSRGRSGKAV
jgi:hypothetical protein